NVLATTHYDALGRAFESVDALGHATRRLFDAAGRTISTIRNYVDGSYDPDSPDTDVISSQRFDALGRAVSTSDPLGATSSTQFDGLGRSVVITDTMGRVTRSGYDGQGALRWQTTPDGRLTFFRLDGLGRVVASITNYNDGLSTSGESDQDLITTT